LLGDAAEFSGVGLALPIEATFLPFVKIPEEIDADRIESHGAAHLKPMPPVFPRNAGEMNLATADQERLSIHEECIRAQRECVTGRLRAIRAGANGGDERDGKDDEGYRSNH